MKYPSTRFVFDRKNTATKNKSAIIQVEILYERKKKYITTGVKVYKDQWDEKRHVCKRNDMTDLNDAIDSVKGSIDEYIKTLIRRKRPFTWEGLEKHLTTIKEPQKDPQGATTHETFIDYITRRVSERTDITDGTKRNHIKLCNSLIEFGRMTTFDELTKPNIADYYEWLQGREIIKSGKNGQETKQRMAQQTVWSYMKFLRVYIHDAMLHEKISHDPSAGIKVRRGQSEPDRWLTEEEVSMIEEAELDNARLDHTRDLFLVQCYSGMAYVDLMDFKPSKIESEGERTYIAGKRIKTGEEYVVLVLPQVQRILDKYGYDLPRLSNQKYNDNLKLVAAAAKVNKNIASHWGRRTFGYMALNHGVRLEVVSRALGHKSTRQTQETYAKVLNKTVVSEMAVLIKK